jgi:DnaJ homolog subfamily A member 2
MGEEIEVEVESVRLCVACDGIGGSDASAIQSCTKCKGKGVTVVMQQLGPGMYTQSQRPC